MTDSRVPIIYFEEPPRAFSTASQEQLRGTAAKYGAFYEPHDKPLFLGTPVVTIEDAREWAKLQLKVMVGEATIYME